MGPALIFNIKRFDSGFDWGINVIIEIYLPANSKKNHVIIIDGFRFCSVLFWNDFVMLLNNSICLHLFQMGSSNIRISRSSLVIFDIIVFNATSSWKLSWGSVRTKLIYLLLWLLWFLNKFVYEKSYPIRETSQPINQFDINMLMSSHITLITRVYQWITLKISFIIFFCVETRPEVYSSDFSISYSISQSVNQSILR